MMKINQMKSPNPSSLTFLVLTIFLVSTPVQAQRFNFSAQSMSAVTASGRETTLLRGNARVISDSLTINADEIELYGAEFRFASARGNVVVLDQGRGIRLEAPNVFFDRKLKISRVNGSAYLEDQKNEIVVRGGFLENRESEDVVLIQIGVRIIKKDLIARSDMARFDRKNQILELTGLPVVVYKGDEFRARRITINIETNEITLDGQVSGTYIPKEAPKSEPAPETAPEAPKVDSPTPIEEERAPK
jgi:lipopolysaccharide export system protein LptA